MQVNASRSTGTKAAARPLRPASSESGRASKGAALEQEMGEVAVGESATPQRIADSQKVYFGKMHGSMELTLTHHVSLTKPNGEGQQFIRLPCALSRRAAFPNRGKSEPPIDWSKIDSLYITVMLALRQGANVWPGEDQESRLQVGAQLVCTGELDFSPMLTGDKKGNPTLWNARVLSWRNPQEKQSTSPPDDVEVAQSSKRPALPTIEEAASSGSDAEEPVQLLPLPPMKKHRRVTTLIDEAAVAPALKRQ